MMEEIWHNLSQKVPHVKYEEGFKKILSASTTQLGIFEVESGTGTGTHALELEWEKEKACIGQE